VWFFLILGALAAMGITTEIWFNLHQQLTPERLAEARARWRKNGPRDYVLEYAIRRDQTPDPARPAPEKYTVRVADGKVESPPRPGEFGSMDDLFAAIDRQLAADRESGGPRPFVKATFDPRDGHIVHYVHSVMRTRERLEVSVQLHPVTASAP
jgi:hypothetical protein